MTEATVDDWNFFKKRMNCELKDCADTFVVNVTQDFIDNTLESDREYQVHCSQCNSKFSIKESERFIFEECFGKLKLTVHKTQFNSLFDAE